MRFYWTINCGQLIMAMVMLIVLLLLARSTRLSLAGLKIWWAQQHPQHTRHQPRPAALTYR